MFAKRGAKQYSILKSVIRFYSLAIIKIMMYICRLLVRAINRNNFGNGDLPTFFIFLTLLSVVLSPSLVSCRLVLSDLEEFVVFAATAGVVICRLQ